MKGQAALLSSGSSEWSTPQDLFDRLNAEFAFVTDCCADSGNAKCSHFFDFGEDGLAQEWKGSCWMNPPYGTTIGQWVRKAWESACSGQATVVCLLPARTDTSWWHDFCLDGEIRFIRRRLKFGDAVYTATFPSVVVIFHKDLQYAGLGKAMKAIL